MADEDIVTGSRIPYLGRKYYTEVFFNRQLTQAGIEFNQSKFHIHVNPAMDVQSAIRVALDTWHRERALGKIKPRVRKLAWQTILAP